jgi:glyoxylase-like metal-dependent hydrolase (beta-lactamase superfamily II)
MKYLQFMILVGAALLMNVACADINKAAAIPDYPADKLSDAAWVIHGPREFPNPENQGFMNNPGIVLTSAGVVIVDPGATLQSGEMVLRVLKTISDKPVVAVFNTHIHGDHWLGNQAMVAAWPKVKIYAHPEMILEARNGAADTWVDLMDTMTKGASKGTVAVLPNTEINNGDTIKIGDTHFRIYHNVHAHTKTDIMIEVVEEQLMFLGDNVTYQRIPRMGDGNFRGSFEAIDMALTSKAKLWVPGHGPSGDVAIVRSYRDYLSGVYQAAKQAFNNNMDSSEVRAIAEKNTVAYRDWPGYDDEIGRHGVQAYAEVEAAEF